MNSLFSQVSAFISSEQPFDEQKFNEIALKVFEYQFDKNEPYRRVCSRRGIKAPKYWKEIPCLTTDLFKTQKLFCLEDLAIAQVFYSSGTTSGEQSKHYLSRNELELYNKSLWERFSEAFYLKKNPNIKYLALSSNCSEAPNSSLVYMFEQIRQKLKAPTNCFFTQNNKLQIERLISELQESQLPILLVGTAFSFVHLLDARPEAKFKLPANSFIMETGGFKGKSREIPKEEFYKLLSKVFDLPLQRIIGQYGMSELGTQYYGQLKAAPAWARTKIIKPNNLQEEVSENEIGLLAHYDLSNLDSLAFVLSGDLAIKRANDKFEILGRAKNLSLKGCSLTTDLNLTEN